MGGVVIIAITEGITVDICSWAKWEPREWLVSPMSRRQLEYRCKSAFKLFLEVRQCYSCN